MIIKIFFACHLLNVKYRIGMYQTVTVGIVYSAVCHACKVIFLIVHIVRHISNKNISLKRNCSCFIGF